MKKLAFLMILLVSAALSGFGQTPPAAPLILQDTAFYGEYLAVEGTDYPRAYPVANPPSPIPPPHPYSPPAAAYIHITPPGVTQWSQIPSNQGPPRSSGASPAIVLAEYSLGALATTRLGYGNAVQTAEDLSSLAGQRITEGSAYKNVNTPLIQQGFGEGAWVILFKGAFNEQTGEPWDGPDSQANFQPAKLREAEQILLAATRANPYNGSLYGKLVETYNERMIPLLYAGNQALSFSSSMRYSRTLQQEVDTLNNYAYARYRDAAQVFLDFTGDLTSPLMRMADLESFPSDTFEAEPANRKKGSMQPRLEQLAQLMGRAVGLQADALVRSYRLRYFNSYVHPEDSQFNAAALNALVSEIDGTYLPDLEAQIMVAREFVAMLQELYGSAAVSRGYLDNAKAGLDSLVELRDAIKRREIAFVSASFAGNTQGNQLNINPDEIEITNYQTYAPGYVPFYNPGDAQGGSVASLASLAKTAATRSALRDEKAESAAREHESNVTALKTGISQVRRSYFSELTALCGSYTNDAGEQVPAVAYSLLTSAQIQGLSNAEFNRLEPKIPGERAIASEIQLQWRKVDEATLGLEQAAQELQNTIDRIRQAESSVQQITNRYNETAEIIQGNGEKLAAFDLQLGQIQADLYKTIDKINKQNQKKTLWGRIGLNVIGQTFNAIATGNWGAPIAAFLDGIGQAAQSHNDAIKATKIADAQADAAIQTAKINEQKTVIHTMERVRAVYDQNFVNKVNSEEKIHSLLLEVQSRKLDILLADQRLDQENAKLASLIGRVQQLLGFYREAIQLETETNPMARPDYRLIRNLKQADAEAAFLRAQERAFLVARAARYKVNDSSRGNDLRNLERNILRARRGEELDFLLEGIEISIANWYTNSVGAPSSETIRISLRHDIFQKNYLERDANQNIVIDASRFEVQPNVQGGTQPTARQLAEASDAAWAKFLEEHTETFFGIKILSLPLSLHLMNDSNTDDFGRAKNPLYNPTAYNMIIRHGASVGVHVEGNQLAGFNASTPIRFSLVQEGTSYIRSSPAVLRRPGPGFLFEFNPDPRATRSWNVLPESGALIGSGQTSLNDTNVPVSHSRQFFERSPANNRWVLEFFSNNGSGTQLLLSNLDKIADIQLVFDVEYFVQQQ